MLKLAGGVGLVFTSLVIVVWSAVGTMIVKHSLTMRDYWWTPLVLIAITSLTVIALSWPRMWHELQSELTEVERLKLEAHRYKLERNAKPARTAYLTPQVTILSDHDRAWKHWLIRCAAESERVGGISWQKMRQFFGDDDKWRVYVDVLAGWGKAWARVPRQETFLKPGITPALLSDLLVGGEIPPTLPDGLPPVLEQRRQADPQTALHSEETDADSPDTGYTAYASTHD